MSEERRCFVCDKKINEKLEYTRLTVFYGQKHVDICWCHNCNGKASVSLDRVNFKPRPDPFDIMEKVKNDFMKEIQKERG